MSETRERNVLLGVEAIRELQDTGLPRSLKLTNAMCRAIVGRVLDRAEVVALASLTSDGAVEAIRRELARGAYQTLDERLPYDAKARDLAHALASFLRSGKRPNCLTCEDSGKVADWDRRKTADHILTDTVPSKPCSDCSVGGGDSG